MSNSNHFISGITFKMYKFLVPVDSCISWFFIILVFRVKCEFFVDSSNSLKRHTKNGFSFANFEANKFSYLNITPLASASVKGVHECGILCLDHSSCVSANFASLFREEGDILCELLPSDRYNNSDKLVFSSVFNHLSIKVGSEILSFYYIYYSALMDLNKDHGPRPVIFSRFSRV